MYNLNEKESLEYIKQRLGKEISGRTYRRYKTNLNNDETTQNWINQYAKVGFLTTYKEIIDVIEIIQKDTLRDYLQKTQNHMKKKTMQNTNL